MSYKELTEEEVLEVTRGSLQIDPGLYFYRDREQEDDPACKQMNHFIYWDGNHWLWSIDYDDSYTWFGIKPSWSYHEARTVSREKFFDFVKERTPDMLDWILFNPY